MHARQAPVAPTLRPTATTVDTAAASPLLLISSTVLNPAASERSTGPADCRTSDIHAAACSGSRGRTVRLAQRVQFLPFNFFTSNVHCAYCLVPTGDRRLPNLTPVVLFLRRLLLLHGSRRGHCCPCHGIPSLPLRRPITESLRRQLRVRQLSSERPSATSRIAGSSGRAGGRGASSAAGGYAGTRPIPRRSRARPPPQPDVTAAPPSEVLEPSPDPRPSPTRETNPARAQLVHEAIQAAQGAWRRNQQLGYQKAEAQREASSAHSENLLPFEQREMAAQLKVQTLSQLNDLMIPDLKNTSAARPASERYTLPTALPSFGTC